MDLVFELVVVNGHFPQDSATFQWCRLVCKAWKATLKKHIRPHLEVVRFPSGVSVRRTLFGQRHGLWIEATPLSVDTYSLRYERYCHRHKTKHIEFERKDKCVVRFTMVYGQAGWLSWIHPTRQISYFDIHTGAELLLDRKTWTLISSSSSS